jgi:hypothetical protein
LRLRQVLPALFVLWILAGIPCAFIGAAAILPWAAGLFVYLLADLLASLWEGLLRRDGAIIPCLAVVFPVEHIAWGGGFWAGWVRLAFRRGPRGGSLAGGKTGSVQ